MKRGLIRRKPGASQQGTAAARPLKPRRLISCADDGSNRIRRQPGAKLSFPALENGMTSSQSVNYPTFSRLLNRMKPMLRIYKNCYKIYNDLIDGDTR